MSPQWYTSLACSPSYRLLQTRLTGLRSWYPETAARFTHHRPLPRILSSEDHELDRDGSAVVCNMLREPRSPLLALARDCVKRLHETHIVRLSSMYALRKIVMLPYVTHELHPGCAGLPIHGNNVPLEAGIEAM